MIFLLLFSFLLSEGIDIITYYDDEELEDVFEPLCDIDFDGDVECEKFLSLA